MSQHHGRRRHPLSRRSSQNKKARRRESLGLRGALSARLGLGHGLERLEDRIVLSSAPVLTFLTPSPVEGDQVNVSFEFTDTVQTGGGSVGLDPNDAAYTSFGAFDPASNVVFNTSSLTMTGSGQSANIALADAGYGQFEIAVFVFDSFELDQGRTISATGSRPLALLSKGSMTIAGVINVSASGIVAGPGGGAGGDLPTFQGEPAAGAPSNPNNALDPTNGHGRNLGNNQGGGGGGFGGFGGGGTFRDTAGNFGPSPSGGASYGDLSVAIQGGSGGAAGVSYSPSYRLARGGGGGGGIELGAVGSIIVSGSILADGANGLADSAFTGQAAGGGGAGGGILIHGQIVDVTSSAVLSARGGDGYGSFPSFHGGGGGGGGRILIAHDANTPNSYSNAGSIHLAGGIAYSTHNSPSGAGSFVAEPVSPSAVAESYSFSINWGDGSPDATGTDANGDITLATSGSQVTGSFSAAHTYADDAGYNVTVTVTDAQGSVADVFVIAVANAAPVLNIAGAGGVDEGSLYTLNLSSSDPGDDTITSWTINWGDVVEVVSGNPASVTHTYADDGNYTISASATDEDGTFAAAATVAVLVANVAPAVSISGSDETDEGSLYTLNLSSSDPGDDTISSWTINWGDSVEVISGNPGSVTHTYADDGNYTITATATDEDGTFAASAGVAVTVANVAPTLAISGAASIDEGSVYTLNLSSSDPGDDTISSWTINWGDSVEVISGNPASVTHTYADDANYTITASATDEDGTFAASAGVAVAVANVAPTLAISGAGSVDEGSPYTLNLSSADPGDDTISSWTINWGDSVEVVSGNPASVTHTYADDANYTITATATDEDGTFSAASGVNVTVNNVAPTLTISGAASVDEGSVYTLNLSSSDPGDDTISSWTINWGDSVEVISGNPASVTHTYADDANYTITATATDEDGTFAASAGVAVAVANVAPTLTISGAASVEEGSVYTLNLSSSDPGADTVQSWTINWGDSVEVITGNPASVTHTYADDASYTITATATDEDGTFAASAGIAVTVANVAPTLTSVTSSASGPVLEGQTVAVSAQFTDVPADTHTVLINWGDGQTTAAAVDQNLDEAAGSHVYAEAGYYTITVTVTDDDGGADAATIDATIAGIKLENGVLIVIGTNDGDATYISESGSSITAYLEVAGGLVIEKTYSTSSVNSIDVQLGGGNDIGIVSASVYTPATVDGGDGDDALAAGNGNTILLGGAGNDVLVGGNGNNQLWGGDGDDVLVGSNGHDMLFGGAGNDILGGGNGNDVLVGGDGDDILIGGNGSDLMIGGDGADLITAGNGDDVVITGSTSYDADLAALNAVMAEWTSNHSYAQRIANLTEQGNNSGAAYRLNGAIFLVTEDADPANATVFEDGDVDEVDGGNGLDWYFATLEGPAEDIIHDLNRKELIEKI